MRYIARCPGHETIRARNPMMWSWRLVQNLNIWTSHNTIFIFGFRVQHCKIAQHKLKVLLRYKCLSVKSIVSPQKYVFNGPGIKPSMHLFWHSTELIAYQEYLSWLTGKLLYCLQAQLYSSLHYYLIIAIWILFGHIAINIEILILTSKKLSALRKS